jgi:hypothetical protein
MVRQVFTFKFEIDLPIGWLSVDIEEIAERSALRLERWQEDGLGWTSGVLVETEAGRMFALVARDALRNRGPQSEVIAEGRDIIALGVDATRRTRKAEEIASDRLWDRAEPLDVAARESHHSLWHRLRAENAPLRVVDADGLRSAPITIFDQRLLSFAKASW